MQSKLNTGVQEIVKNSSDLSTKVMVGAGVGTSSGILGWLSDNAAAIGAICTIIGLLLMIFFRTWELIISRNESKFRMEQMKKEKDNE